MWSRNATTSALLFGGFVATVVVWIVLSLAVAVSRFLYDRRDRPLVDIEHTLAHPSPALLSQAERVAIAHAALERLSRRSVYRMVDRNSLPLWVRELCAQFLLERWGLRRLLRDASPGRSRRKWRRIAALAALAQLRADSVHDLLETAVLGRDPEIASAAVVLLRLLGDRRAAEILVTALCRQTYAPSRIATQIEQFPIPVDDLLRALLIHPLEHVRYWATSLLIRYPDVPGLAVEIAAAARDSHPPVRKAAMFTLALMDPDIAGPAVRGAIADPVHYVRSTAVRALGTLGMRTDNLDSRANVAAAIAPLLADVAWDVRLAAKETLVALGPSIWRQVASRLDSADPFARNGAAEVLQNIGVLDELIDEVTQGRAPSDELVDVLGRALHEGGAVMVEAAVARSDPDVLPRVQRLLARLHISQVSQVSVSPTPS